MSTHDSLAVFAALAAELQHEPDEAVTARAIVSGMCDLVPEAGRVSLSLRVARRPHRTLAGTDPVAEEVDALQHALGEGPCLAVADGQWLRSADVGTDARWPSWGPSAAQRGVRSLLSVAVTDRDGPVGSIHLYSGERGAFADQSRVEVALAYAVHAATALSFARRARTMQEAVSSRHVIGMAQGIVMVRYGIDQHQSFELLRRLSSTSNVKLRDVAARIVETRTVPSELSPGLSPEPATE